MTKVARLEAVIAIAVADDADPEEVAMSFDSGMSHALEHFPGGEVISASVESGRWATEQEIKEHGWEE